MKTLGQRIHELRTEAGLTQVQLAEQVGVTHTTVSQWEAGLRVPRWANVGGLCEAFNIPYAELMEGVEL